MKPKVILDNEVWRKIMHWVNKSNYEVSGLGTLTCDANGVFHVKSAMLLPQKNGATHTDIEPEDVGKLMFALKDAPGDLRFWWHSHVDMPVFWSGTDMATIEKIGAGGWFLSSVFNKKNEVRSAFYAVEGQITPWGKTSLFLDELETEVAPLPNQETAAWDAEYETNVTNALPRHTEWVGRQWDQTDYLRGNDVITLPDQNRKRPVGMSKRDWKALKREQKATSIAMPDEIDDYGFTQDERIFFAKVGWDESDFDDLSELDVTPIEMLSLATADILPHEVGEMIKNGWTLKDVIAHADGINEQSADDSPVMDRAQGGKYDA